MILTFCVTGYGQDTNELESILQKSTDHTEKFDAYLELYELYEVPDIDQAKAYLDEAMKLAKQNNYQTGVGKAYIYYGDYYIELGELEKAADMYSSGKEVYETIKDSSGLAKYWNGMGTIETYKGDFEAALGNFIEAAKLYEQIKDTMGLVMAYHNIGGMNFQQERFDKALEYWNKGLELEHMIQDSIGIILSLDAISLVHTVQGNYQEALNMQYAALDLAKLSGTKEEVATVLNNIGAQHQYLHQFDSAQYYFVWSLELNKEINEKYDIIPQYINLGQIAYKQQDGKTAKAYFDTSLALSKEIGSALFIQHSYGGLADANKVLGNYEEAFEWLDKWYHLKDSLSGEDVKIELNKLQEKYEAEQKDKELQQMKKREAYALLVADRRMWFLIVGLTLAVSVILIVLLYIARRRAHDQKNRIELEQRALRTQMNPHFIFNSLGAIQQMYVTGELDLANNYMADFSSLMRKILENSRKDLISVKEEFDMLELYLELEKSRSNELLDYEIAIHPNVDLMGTKIPPMVIQPFVENAIWHGVLPLKKKGKVTISLNVTENLEALICSVEDNGVGFQNKKQENGHESQGMKITEERLGTRVEIEDLTPGTRITIKILI
jgi:tetratricopeptide (TPR) repeat protein